ncbi:MAG: ABC transporter permease [Rhodobacteraceae bacterium]|jgi:peptide/nickel transport system permease protein|uniref:Peptide/nickel transport system permease protein n=1 Tax=Salipiger profundus TaxID=1229727 RepID=A0A1U7D7P3_9RHOB|nr:MULTISPECIES: ABC transporter permease [Salipiger]APX24143.1 peptide/nickel transport system permease protein [Salipiger profundus]MAB06929.1 ABC transporter permease [Paracoccaceae bacterium]GFZ94932.1 peptide ABC transporter permease [Salipiger profundus]SFB89874.1 peptide/nickel transport system permease protein [Salipiger profundus]
MLRYIAFRSLVALFLVWVVVSVVFLLLHLIPGDPAELLLSTGNVAADPAAVAALREQMGLNDPIWQQYLDHMAGVLTGDLGASFRDGAPVSEQIAQRLPRTLEVILAAAIIATGIGVPLGTYAAIRADGKADATISFFASAALSTPVFVVGSVVILIFAQELQWLPAGGFVPFSEDPVEHIKLLLMPACTVALTLLAVITRMSRASVLEVLQRDYVRTARAKGLKRTPILRRHVVRNALIPVLTVLGLEMGTLIGGTVLVEFVFNWPGLSGYLVSAVDARDYPEVVGIVMTISILFVFLNLVVDVVNAILDPRISLVR